MVPTKLKLGIWFDKYNLKYSWSFGVALKHWSTETYLIVNFLCWFLIIGKREITDWKPTELKVYFKEEK